MGDAFDYWKFLAGLGIFLFGMNQIETALQKIAGRSFRAVLHRNTDTTIKAIITGTVITALLQSSSIVSLMTLAMVGAGIMSLTSALGIIIGSNLGTTLKGWIVAIFGFKFSIESFSLPMLAVGGITYILLNRYEKPANTGRLLAGFGFLFLGLDFMKTSIEFLAENFDITPYSSYGPVVFLLVGFVLTAIIQSSSATMVITLSALNSDLITFHAAAAMVIGADLGTTITALIGGLPGIPIKKRVALGHFMFNLVTDLIAFLFMIPITAFITDIIGIKDELVAVVAFHSSFNFIGILIFAPTLKYFARFLDNRFSKKTFHAARFIHNVSSDFPDSAIAAMKNETMHILIEVQKLHEMAFRTREPGFWSGANAFQDQYRHIKMIEGEIFKYYNDIQKQQLINTESEQLNGLVQVIRYALHAAKSLKDIEPNLRDIQSADTEAMRLLFLAFQSTGDNFGRASTKFLESDQLNMEDLVQLSVVVQKDYDSVPALLVSKKIDRSIPSLELSTILTINREIYSSHRSFILALNFYFLSPDAAKEFSNLGILGK